MPTNAYIVIETTDKNGNAAYKASYIHSDGYPGYAQAVLNKFYTAPSKVAKLMGLGAISILGKYIGKKHSFGDRCKDELIIEGIHYSVSKQCTAYRRDCGESRANTCSDIWTRGDLLRIANADYVYLWNPDSRQWEEVLVQNFSTHVP